MNEDFNTYEENVINIDDIGSTDIKINPDYYIHIAMVKANNCLAGNDLKSDLMRYRLLIEHIELLCNSANKLDDDYKDTVKKYQEELNNNSKLTEEQKSTKMAQKKLNLMMAEVFASKTITDPLILKSKVTKKEN